MWRSIERHAMWESGFLFIQKGKISFIQKGKITNENTSKFFFSFLFCLSFSCTAHTSIKLLPSDRASLDHFCEYSGDFHLMSHKILLFPEELPVSEWNFTSLQFRLGSLTMFLPN